MISQRLISKMLSKVGAEQVTCLRYPSLSGESQGAILGLVSTDIDRDPSTFWVEISHDVGSMHNTVVIVHNLLS